MSEDPEPARNISGGAAGGGRATAFEPGIAGTSAEAVVDRLGELYWEKAYGGRDAFDCLVRTILSQNTSDTASQPAYDALVERYDDGNLAAALASADRSSLADTIQPAGLHNQKSEALVGVATSVLETWGDAKRFDDFVRTDDYDAVRDALLDLNGVGPKTADCVLLFAGGRGGVFPVDTHVHRIARRLGIAPPEADHETVRAHLEAAVPPEKCGFGHTAMIQFGREYCTARQPACLDDPEACPMVALCDQVGVDPESGEVADPGQTASNPRE